MESCAINQKAGPQRYMCCNPTISCKPSRIACLHVPRSAVFILQATDHTSPEHKTTATEYLLLWTTFLPSPAQPATLSKLPIFA